MSAVQKQELSLFSDHSVLTKALFQQNEHHVIYVTHKLGTSPSWLMNALIETQVFGSPLSLNESHASAVNHASSRVPVQRSGFSSNGRRKAATIASWIHDSEFFHTALGKLKIDPASYQIQDYLTDFVLKNHGKPASRVLKSLVEELTSTQSQSDLLLLEQPELLMHLLNVSSDELHLDFINPLARAVPLMVIVSYTESHENPGAEALEHLAHDLIEQIRFQTGCVFKSIAVLGIKPLATGRAKDVTGTLTITRGGAETSHLAIDIAENEYLFHTQKDTTKLFYR
ncbi:LAME_0H00716g1_1 [Lachancea meyersii CBS 8951]|uniref:LAME_0H00716g1_1 n=1 Tax=Lachancea meyersii CBS 8951 TaxID=1266667 RepID=A0A1G4KD43_9SACH|nr:LAME_0H00716g1_1 [Lachancea meyersii CBS 8951]